MQYPREFTPEARARVEAERLRATREYELKRDELEPGYGHLYKHEENLRSFILRVFLAFAREACKIGLDGVWTVDTIRSEGDEFLRRFAIEAYYDYGHDRNGFRLPKITAEWGHLRLTVVRAFRKSSEWHQYEDELLAVAEKIAKRAARQSRTQSNMHNAKRRAEIEAFITRLAESGHKISRKDIWTAAGYEDATEFERFQRESDRTTDAAASNFNRVLKMKPEDFMRLLEKHRSK